MGWLGFLLGGVPGHFIEKAIKSRYSNQNQGIAIQTAKYTEEELKFCFAIASFMSFVDGRQDPEEQKLLKDELEEAKTLSISETLQNELSAIILDPPSFETILKMYNAIESKNIEMYRNLLSTIARKDGLMEEAETVFLYKMELLFEGIRTSEIFKIISTDEEKVTVSDKHAIITFLSIKEVKKQYPDTIPNFDDYFLLHPANPKELISITDIINADFIRDKDTEVLEAMRIAGAKRVLISIVKRDCDEKSIDTQLNAGVNVNRIVNVESKAGFSSSDLSDLRENEFIEAKYTGSMNGIFAKQKFIRNSVWVKNDAKLSWLFNARFQPNKVTYFKWDVEYQSIVEKVISANIAVKCGVAKIGKANMKASTEFNSEKLLSIKKLFIAEF